MTIIIDEYTTQNETKRYSKFIRTQLDIVELPNLEFEIYMNMIEQEPSNHLSEDIEERSYAKAFKNRAVD